MTKGRTNQGTNRRVSEVRMEDEMGQNTRESTKRWYVLLDFKFDANSHCKQDQNVKSPQHFETNKETYI